MKQSLTQLIKLKETMVWFLVSLRNSVQRPKVAFCLGVEQLRALEGMMISGYSVLGSPVFSILETDEAKQIEVRPNQVRLELNRNANMTADHSTWMNKQVHEQ